MSRFSLIPFIADTAPDIIICGEITQNAQALFINYKIQKNLSLIDLGNSSPNKTRLIKLWEKSCFEFFIKNQKDQYIEFNFSPRFEWNCFYFEKRGDALAEWQKMQAPEIEIVSTAEKFDLKIIIKKEYFPNGFFNQESVLVAGITSVIKEKSGPLSYWALAHADSRPNFHHFDSFKYKF